jgi:nucleotide-binding universal stress UspA family protein
MGVAMAAREEARLTGLHMVRLGASKDTPEVEMVREAFLRRCAEAGVAGRLLVEEGPAAERLCQRSVWVDLVVFRMNYPPPTQPWKRLRSGARTIIRRCPVPIFAVPEAPFLLNSALLAYGPGRMADEALFVATYLAGRWNIALTVLTVEEPDMRKTRLDDHGAISPSERARSYLEAHGVQAQIMEERGPLSSDPARAILFTAEAREAGFIIMGGYEAGPLRESLTGSTTDRVLRSTRRPVLICR